MKGYFGIKVKSAGMVRSLWLSPRGVTRLRIHASCFETAERAQSVLDELMADERNAHILGKVEAFS